MMMEPRWGRPGDGIRESLEKKASRYGALDAPYVVAVNSLLGHQGEEDAMDALLGTPCMRITTFEDGSVEERWDREGDGVWSGDRGPRKRGLSAVLSTEGITPWSFAGRNARLVRNPWATRPLGDLGLGVDELNPGDEKFVKTAGRDLGDLLGLTAGWPEVEE